MRRDFILFVSFIVSFVGYVINTQQGDTESSGIFVLFGLILFIFVINGIFKCSIIAGLSVLALVLSSLFIDDTRSFFIVLFIANFIYLILYFRPQTGESKCKEGQRKEEERLKDEEQRRTEEQRRAEDQR